MYIFQTDRLGFRQWQDTDTEPFAHMNADPEVMEFFPATLSQGEAAAFITRVRTFIDGNGFGLWAVDEKATGNFIGFIGLTTPRFESFFTPCIEIGWRLAKPYWGKGYATEGAKASLDYGFSALGFEKIYSFTAITNKHSERIMQKIGMTRVGEFDHPSLQIGHPLCRHVLYKIDRPIVIG